VLFSHITYKDFKFLNIYLKPMVGYRKIDNKLSLAEQTILVKNLGDQTTEEVIYVSEIRPWTSQKELEYVYGERKA
jgi:hypothetical protein